MGRLMRIEVEPSSGEDKIIPGEPAVVKVKAPASGGAANRSVVRLLSERFKQRVRIVSGGKRSRKIVEIG